MTLPFRLAMEKNLLCGKKNTSEHGHFGTVAANFVNLFSIFQSGQSNG